MARGKYVAKKLGTSPPSGDFNGGAGSPIEVDSARVPAAASSQGAGSQAKAPALGIMVMSPWGWRILTMATLVALGICITFFLDGHTAFGALWVIVVVGWAGFSFKLWRMHLAWDAL